MNYLITADKFDFPESPPYEAFFSVNLETNNPLDKDYENFIMRN